MPFQFYSPIAAALPPQSPVRKPSGSTWPPLVWYAAMSFLRRENRVTRLTTLLALAALLTAAAPGPAPHADEPRSERHLLVGTGEVIGFHYPVGGAVCRLLNRERERHRLHCAVEPTAGSTSNLSALRVGMIDLAVVQSGAHRQSWEGIGAFQHDGPFRDLRSLFALHGESVALVATRTSGISSIGDLAGKRVNLGRPKSFQRNMAEAVLTAAGIAPAALGLAMELDLDKQAGALCEGRADAAFFTVVHPMSEVQRALAECDTVIVDLKDAGLAAYVKDKPYLAQLTIPAQLYSGQENDVGTVGMRATLVTTARLPADDAYEVVKAVFDHLGAFTGMHPVLARLTRERMAVEGLTAPLHEGALRYYKEAGLID